MLVDFQSINELAILVYYFNQEVVVGNIIVNQDNFPQFISMTFDT